MRLQPLLSNSDLALLQQTVRTGLYAILRQYDAAIRMKLVGDINQEFVIDILAQQTLESDTLIMNAVQKLRDGTVPLEIWTRNAIQLLHNLPQEAILEELLEKIRQQTAVVPTPPSTPVAPPAIPGVIAADPAGDNPGAPAAETKPTVFEVITDGLDDMLSIAWHSTALTRGKSVVRLLVPRYFNGVQETLTDGSPNYASGTGWVIAPGLIITNHHVVNARGADEAAPTANDFSQQGRETLVQFDYDASTATPLVSKVEKLEIADAGLDFAILRLTAIPDPPRGPLPIAKQKVSLPPPVLAASGHIQPVLRVANIIQHPSGGPKKTAFRNNYIYKADDRLIHYFTDTLTGSSGSPVFNDAWTVVALHHAGTAANNILLNGTMARGVNEGIQITAILEFLQANNPGLLAEIP